MCVGCALVYTHSQGAPASFCSYKLTLCRFSEASAMTLIPEQSLVVPDHNFPGRLSAFTDRLLDNMQISVEVQQYLAFQLSQNSTKRKAFYGNIADTQASILALTHLQEALCSASAMQQSILSNSSRVKRITKDVHFSLSGGSARLQLHTC